MLTCPDCDGEKEVHSHNSKCPTCNGKGTISENKFEQIKEQEEEMNKRRYPENKGGIYRRW